MVFSARPARAAAIFDGWLGPWSCRWLGEGPGAVLIVVLAAVPEKHITPYLVASDQAASQLHGSIPLCAGSLLPLELYLSSVREREYIDNVSSGELNGYED